MDTEKGKIEPTATSWAPSQHKGMRCACIHWDAAECLKLRCFKGTRYEDRYRGRDVDGECECSCHDRDEFDPDEFEIARG